MEIRRQAQAATADKRSACEGKAEARNFRSEKREISTMTDGEDAHQDVRTHRRYNLEDAGNAGTTPKRMTHTPINQDA